MDEYVPIITPIIMANEKPFKISPPKTKIDPSANKVVTDVIIVLDNVSFIEVFEMSSMVLDEYLERFSLIRSYITTVSFIEYPTIVSTAATIERLTSRDSKEKIPKVIRTS